MSRKKPKRIFLLAAFVVGGGAVYEFSTEDTSSPEHVTLSADAENRLKHASPSIPLTTPIFESAAKVQKQSLGNMGKNMAVAEESEKADKKSPSDSTKLVRYFYDMYLHSSSIRAKMDNLRWACEVFADEPTPDVIAKVAAALEVDKDQFIKTISDAANAHFKEAARVSTASYSRYDQMTFWNDLRLSYAYTGLTPEGEYKESLAQSATGYTYDNLVRTRNSYVVNATAEIIQDISATAASLEKAFTASLLQNLKHNTSWGESLETMNLPYRQDLRNKLYLITYALDKHSHSTPQAGMALFGLTEKTHETIMFLTEPLDRSIAASLNELAKGYEQSPAKKPNPETIANDPNAQLRFSDIIYVFNGALFHKEPR